MITSKLEAFRPESGPGVGAPRTEAARPSAEPARTPRPRRRPVAASPPARRSRRRPRQPRPSFRGPHLADFIGWWRRLRSIVFLILITVILGVILAAIVAVAIGAIVVTIQHALKSG